MRIKTLLNLLVQESSSLWQGLSLWVSSAVMQWAVRPFNAWVVPFFRRWVSAPIRKGVWSPIKNAWFWALNQLYRRRDERRAKEKLDSLVQNDASTGPTPQGTGKTAQQSTDSALSAAARGSAVGILPPGEVKQEPTDQLSPEIESVGPVERPAAAPEEVGLLEDADAREVAGSSSQTGSGKPPKKRAENAHSRVYKRFSDFEDSDRETTSTSTLETRFTERMEDAQLLPIPYRGDVKKMDIKGIRGWWTSNPNAEEEIQEAVRQPIVDNHIRTLVEHLTTSNPKIQGDNDDNGADVVRKWIRTDVELTSGHDRGLHDLVEKVAKQMLRYGSAVVIKQRTRAEVGGKYKNTITGREDYPVSNFIVPDMDSLEVFIDEKGRARKWRQSPDQYPDGKTKTYPNRDVYMCSLPVRESAMYFWTPSIVMPSLYAINALSDLHGIIDAHTDDIVDIPAIAKVGSKNYNNAKVTGKMIEDTEMLISGTPRGDVMVVPHYVDVETIETKDYLESLVAASEFWDKIVRRGTGGTSLQDGIGDSGTRNTSDNLTDREMRGAEALVPSIQRLFRWLTVDKLMENGIDPTEYPDHKARPGLYFEDIDMSKQTRRESHHIYLFLHDAITHGELRTRLGEDKDPDRADKYYSDIAEEVQSTAESSSRERPGGSGRPKNKNR
jgi:hypothetical protein